MKGNMHTHSCFSDGANTPEEMLHAAEQAGFSVLGFSDHSPFFCYDCTWSGKPEKVEEYRQTVRGLRSGSVKVLCGMENDRLSGRMEGFDYLIGAVHTLRKNGQYVEVDNSRADTEKLIELYGSPLCLAEAFFDAEVQMVQEIRPDIIAHFDLLMKYGDGLIEETPEYRTLACAAVDEVMKTCRRFEINTGAVARHIDRIYPAPFLLKHLHARGAEIVLSSDSHSVHTLEEAFPRAKALLREAGFAYTVLFDGETWEKEQL